jgi:hypothetical protein
VSTAQRRRRQIGINRRRALEPFCSSALIIRRASRSWLPALLPLGSNGSTHTKWRAHCAAAARMNSRLPRGSRDRNRTCNLRLWSTRRSVQDHPAKPKLLSNAPILATSRRDSTKDVQPVCSQFCSRACVRPSAQRRSSHEPKCTDFACTPQSDLPPLLHLNPYQGAGHHDLLVLPCAN